MNDHPSNYLAIRFSDALDPKETGTSVMQFGVYDGETGKLLGITIQLGSEPVMMLPLVEIPKGAIRFDAERDEL
jgi:hypothetical protein